MKEFMKRICRWLGTDGLLHILCSMLIVMTAGIFLPVWIAVVTALVVGVAKELVWDRWLGRGHASWHDIVCNLIGIAMGAAVLALGLFV